MKLTEQKKKKTNFEAEANEARGKWVNNHTIVEKDIDKPCHKLGHCPYGQLVEAFPLPDTTDDFKCKVFGHHCPVFYHYEDFAEEE